MDVGPSRERSIDGRGMSDIWMYWENKPGSQGMPPFAQLCVESVRRNAAGARVHLLDQHSVREHLPDLRPEWDCLAKLAHKADYVRTRLVLLHGGLWLDCDMVALHPLDRLLELPPEHDFACQDLASAIGCFAARPGCQLLHELTAAQDAVLDRSPNDFGWNGIGNDLLAQIGKNHRCHLWPKWTVDEVAGGKVTKLLASQETPENNVDANAVVFHFCGNLLSPLLNTYAPHRKERLLNQCMLMSRILRRGLAIPEPPAWQQSLDFARLQDWGAGAVRRLHRLRGHLSGRGSN